MAIVTSTDHKNGATMIYDLWNHSQGPHKKPPNLLYTHNKAVVTTNNDPIENRPPVIFLRKKMTGGTFSTIRGVIFRL